MLIVIHVRIFTEMGIIHVMNVIIVILVTEIFRVIKIVIGIRELVTMCYSIENSIYYYDHNYLQQHLQQLQLLLDQVIYWTMIILYNFILVKIHHRLLQVG